MNISIINSVPEEAEVRAVPVHSDRIGKEPYELNWRLLEALGFEGKEGQVQVISGDGAAIAVVGAGESGTINPATLRSVSASLARAVSGHKRMASFLLDAVPAHAAPAKFVQAHVEGLILGGYGFHNYKSEAKPNKLREVFLVTADGGDAAAGLGEALARGKTVAEAVCLARDLVNEPGGSLTPEKLAETARTLAVEGDDEPLEVEVWGLKKIQAQRLGGLLGVNRGSIQEPRFVKLAWRPENAEGFLALVGKGITFDSGGLSIKPASGMETMKMDMGGAAAVLATMKALRTLTPKVRVEAYLPITDNMTGGDATRPGDVLRIRNGKTVEVMNTDAEGRLILADALSLATEAGPDAIVDLATLTGACMVALGLKLAGLMSNQDDFATTVKEAAERAGERVWHLPLPADYRKQLDSEVADINNVGKRWGGTLTAGLFLKEFVPDEIPWAHLDIAGPAWAESVEGETLKGGTGFGVRLLVELISTFKAPPAAAREQNHS